MVAAGLIGVVATPASAGPKTFEPAEALCTAQGSNFLTFVNPTGYQCGPSEGEVPAARALCERAYRGVFIPSRPTATFYTCILS